ncbi:methyltransferase domain-containing protein [Bosea sp. (in: a-proteobacteria)]|uniref:class I SAM-dependent methyltransferase n=1 Tax=Bosea sp. (in: a-proteobacteria) TaxID=1871050 RepID=UPI0025BEF5E0|nr:methyltransferase domain-containing protein [Bosea sp. (in: a-proteobacteria)]MBR3190420.1 methyltransferase type 12 [Bosea sp. (in: a-proteobacteria)]
MTVSDTTGQGGEASRSASNTSTLAGYEGCADEYAETTAPKPETDDQPALVELLKVLEPASRLLEIGSGPGWDADWLEERGLVVRRTDGAESFVQLQASRGRRAERLDVIGDPLGGPYDGIIALHVLQHIERELLPPVFTRIAEAIRVGGVFLLALREGQGESAEIGSKGNEYYVALWPRAEIIAILDTLGFDLRWSHSFEGREGRWLTALFRKGAPQ